MNRKYNAAPHAIYIVKMDCRGCLSTHMSTPTPVIKYLNHGPCGRATPRGTHICFRYSCSSSSSSSCNKHATLEHPLPRAETRGVIDAAPFAAVVIRLDYLHSQRSVCPSLPFGTCMRRVRPRLLFHLVPMELLATCVEARDPLRG